MRPAWDRVEDGRIAGALVQAEGGQMLASLMARHHQSTLKQHDQIAFRGGYCLARASRRDARPLYEVDEAALGDAGEQPRTPELIRHGFHGRAASHCIQAGMPGCLLFAHL